MSIVLCWLLMRNDTEFMVVCLFESDPPSGGNNSRPAAVTFQHCNSSGGLVTGPSVLPSAANRDVHIMARSAFSRYRAYSFLHDRHGRQDSTGDDIYAVGLRLAASLPFFTLQLPHWMTLSFMLCSSYSRRLRWAFTRSAFTQIEPAK